MTRGRGDTHHSWVGDLTWEERDTLLLAFIAAFIEERGYSPTMREITDASPVGLHGTHRHLKLLRERGKITWLSGKNRTIRVVDGG